MIYDERKEEEKNTSSTGYVNVGSSGTGSANRYENPNPTAGRNPNPEPNPGMGPQPGTYRNPQSRPHYTSYQDANYRMPNYNPGHNMNPNPGMPPKKKGGFWKKAVAAIVVGVLLGGSAAGAFYGVYKIAGLDDAVETISGAGDVVDEINKAKKTTADKSSSEKEEVRETVVSSSDGSLSVSDVVDDVMPSVVAITNEVMVKGQTWWGQPIEQTGESAGSGIIVGENDDEYLIVTNQHVIDDASSLSVQFVDESTAEANLKGEDEAADIAVIAVAKSDLDDDTLDAIKVARLGDSDKLVVGQQVIAIGNAMGYGQSTTTGIISALGREAEFDTGSHELIQTDAAINPGNSGGALLNMDGELIGINEAKAGQVLSNGTIVEGMGYAIPISTVEPLIDELMTKETKTKASKDNQSYLGIGGVDVTEDVASNYDIPEGIYVAQVEPGSAADKAGLTRGDVITEFDGQSVSSMEDLKDLMLYYEAGETVDLTVKVQSDKGYKEETISVTLDKRPSDNAN